MTKPNKFKSSNLLKNFEVGKSALSVVVGGNYEEPTAWSEGGNSACSHSCPDYNVDVRSNNGNLLYTY